MSLQILPHLQLRYPANPFYWYHIWESVVVDKHTRNLLLTTDPCSWTGLVEFIFWTTIASCDELRWTKLDSLDGRSISSRGVWSGRPKFSDSRKLPQIQKDFLTDQKSKLEYYHHIVGQSSAQFWSWLALNPCSKEKETKVSEWQTCNSLWIIRCFITFQAKKFCW